MTEQQQKFDGFWFMGFLALVAYVIPWVFNPGMTLSPGAYDFAELLAKRNMDNTGYNTMLALRGQLFLITTMLAIRTHRPYFTGHWWAHTIVCGLLIIAQLPPLTFFSHFNDINQQQQAMLAGASLIATVIGLSGFAWKYRHIVILIASIIGIISIIYGLVHALDILSYFSLPANVGVGGIALGVIYGLLILWTIFRQFLP